MPVEANEEGVRKLGIHSAPKATCAELEPRSWFTWAMLKPAFTRLRQASV
jgi:hypothetical protein